MSKNILLVDDDADIRTFVVTVIKENGFTPNKGNQKMIMEAEIKKPSPSPTLPIREGEEQIHCII